MHEGLLRRRFRAETASASRVFDADSPPFITRSRTNGDAGMRASKVFKQQSSHEGAGLGTYCGTSPLRIGDHSRRRRLAAINLTPLTLPRAYPDTSTGGHRRFAETRGYIAICTTATINLLESITVLETDSTIYRQLLRAKHVPARITRNLRDASSHFRTASCIFDAMHEQSGKKGN